MPSISLRPRAALRSRTVLAAVASVVLPFAWLIAAPATVQGEGQGSDGQTLTVEYDGVLSADGTPSLIKGTGFSESKGLYVAVCVDNGEGKRPTPCIGGVDETGEAKASKWISSNPPSYGKGLAAPFGPDGSFELELIINASDANTDCQDPASAPNGCVLATYADHTRLEDRSLDIRIPLNFSETAPEPESTTTEPAADESTPAATPTPSAAETTEPTATATATATAADAEQKPSGTPREFWIWISLAAIALIGAVAVIRSKARKNLALDDVEPQQPEAPEEPQEPEHPDA